MQAYLIELRHFAAVWEVQVPVITVREKCRFTSRHYIPRYFCAAFCRYRTQCMAGVTPTASAICSCLDWTDILTIDHKRASSCEAPAA